jgi:hypothetical protein
MESWEKISSGIEISEVATDIDLKALGGSRDGTVSAVLKFNPVLDGFFRDIQVQFEEKFNQIPTIGRGRFPNGAYPLLWTNKSRWLEEYSHLFRDQRFRPCKHYIFFSLNDVLEVLASDEPTVEILQNSFDPSSKP